MAAPSKNSQQEPVSTDQSENMGIFEKTLKEVRCCMNGPAEFNEALAAVVTGRWCIALEVD